jgi:SAM-dependent methyltransferase
MGVKKTKDIHKLVSKVNGFPVDRTSIPQDRLNLVNRGRKSLFPWRGQFSPELIELLLTHYAGPKAIILDPFAGSGTTLFEASRKSLTCFGVEINPAAVEIARTVHFVNIDIPKRVEYIHKAEAIFKRYSPHYRDLDFFLSKDHVNKIKVRSSEEAFSRMLREASNEPGIYNIVINTILRYTVLRGKKDSNALSRAFKIHKNIVMKLPYSKNPCKLFYGDARKLPLDEKSVDFIVTSPPYINVFNYHQNYREVMELAGWNLLKVAKSEIGSNRKNRGNRFLTVIQYSIDMLQALCEIRRVIRSDGRIIIIIGRESKVRGVSFENFKILSTLAIGGACLKLVCRQERKFVNRFGKTIYEDLLHFVPTEKIQHVEDDFARSVGVYFLKEAVDKTSDKVREDIISAIAQTDATSASPLFQTESCGRFS